MHSGETIPTKQQEGRTAAIEERMKAEDLKNFLTDVVEKRHGYDLGEPWKFSENALLVVVPIIRKDAPNRSYTTMYEVLKDMGMKDTGHIDIVELQNKSGKAVFVRAGTIFAGETQNRAAQHSGVYKEGSKVDVPVRCVHQTHGIRTGAKMAYGSIAPLSITENLMARDQHAVWSSVRDYTTTHEVKHRAGRARSSYSSGTHYAFPQRSYRGRVGGTSESPSIGLSDEAPFLGFVNTSGVNIPTDDLLGYIKSEGKSALDEMMQKVPLFEDQAGAVIFNPVGVLALETFDSPKSWEAVKKEIIEKYGDHVSNEQAEHLFELQKDKILPMLKKFVAGLDSFEERTIRQDDLSETRAVKGENVIGEYTLVKGRTIHCLLIREQAS